MKKKILLPLAAAALVTLLPLGANAAPPHADYKLVFEDEFDKPIDENVWFYRIENKMGGVSRPENVSVQDGRMIQEIKYDDIDGVSTPTGGGIISRQFFGYGYYETKSKLFGETGGLHSSFWTCGYGGGGDGVLTPKYNLIYEIDGYEVESSKKSNITCNLNTYVGGHAGYSFTPSTDVPTDEEFVLGFEWLPNEINWYLNGKLIQTKKGEEIPIFYAQQNLWVTALANTEISGAIDKDKLPGHSSWDYVRYYAQPLKDVNLIGASEFEFNDNPDYAQQIDMQYPMAWMESGDIAASFVKQTKDAFGGNNVLMHNSNQDYKVTTSQRLYNIPNANYELTAWVKSATSKNPAKIRVSDFGGSAKEIELPQTDEWTQVKIDGINVTGNSAYVEIISDGKANDWTMVDNISFYATEGREVEKNIPYATDLSNEVIGLDVVTIADTANFSKTGEWVVSNLKGYGGDKSTYTYGKLDGESATFNLVSSVDGKCDINYYVVGYNNSSPQMHVSYTIDGKTTEKYLDCTKESGWEVLGTEELKKGQKVTVTVDNKNKAGILRASAAGLSAQGSIALKDVMILKMDESYVLSYGKKLRLDAENMKVVPVAINDRTMVPLRFIGENMGAAVAYDDATETVTITYEGKEIAFVIDKNMMKVDGKEITLDAPATIINDRTLVPIRAVSEAFGKKVSWVAEKYIIIADKEYDPSQSIIDVIDGLL